MALALTLSTYVSSLLARIFETGYAWISITLVAGWGQCRFWCRSREGKGNAYWLTQYNASPDPFDLCFFSSNLYFLNGMRLGICYISGWLGAMLIVLAGRGREEEFLVANTI